MQSKKRRNLSRIRLPGAKSGGRGANPAMNWFRSKIRSCARLALFALAFQMAVSFGHMHRDDLGLAPLPGSDSAQIASVTTALRASCRSGPTPGAGRLLPDLRQHAAHRDGAAVAATGFVGAGTDPPRLAGGNAGAGVFAASRAFISSTRSPDRLAPKILKAGRRIRFGWRPKSPWPCSCEVRQSA